VRAQDLADRILVDLVPLSQITDVGAVGIHLDDRFFVAVIEL